MSTIKLIDPRKIRLAQLPCIVLVDNMQSWLSWRIKAHTKGNYSHVMWMVRPFHFLSQDVGHGFREVPLADYMKPYIRMKFVQPAFTQAELLQLQVILATKLEHGKEYDLLGIIGQRLGLKWLQNPKKDYCSEGVAKDMAEIDYPIDFGIAPSPSDINCITKANQQHFKVIGLYQEE
jgi:hypothetical protein